MCLSAAETVRSLGFPGKGVASLGSARGPSAPDLLG